MCDAGQSVIDADVWCDVDFFAGHSAGHDTSDGDSKGTRVTVGRAQRGIAEDIDRAVDVESVEIREGDKEDRD